MDTVVIEHGEISIWKIDSAGAPITFFTADLMVPLCVTTATRWPGNSLAILSRANSILWATLSYDSPSGGANAVEEIHA